MTNGFRSYDVFMDGPFLNIQHEQICQWKVQNKSNRPGIIPVTIGTSLSGLRGIWGQ